MPLPSSGSISFADINIELGNNSNDRLDLDYAAAEFGLSQPHGMDEFYGLSAGYNFTFPDWDGSVSITEFGVIYYSIGNAASVTINTSNFGPIASTTTQTVNVTITAPSTFNGQPVDNAGSSLTDDVSATQQAVGRYLDIAAAEVELEGSETSVSLTVTDTYYNDISKTPWEITVGPSIYDNQLGVVSFLPITGEGTQTTFVTIAENTSGETIGSSFTVTGTIGGKTDSVDVSQTSYTPIPAPTISIQSISPSGPYPYTGISQIAYTISKTDAASYTAQISPGIDGNNAQFSEIQPGGITYIGPSYISGTTNTFYVEIPARDDNSEDTKDSYLTVSVSTGGGSDSDSDTISQSGVPVYAWGGSLFITRNDGVVNVTGDDSAGTITLTPSSFGLVATSTPRTVVVGNIVIPNGYQDAGTSFSEVVSVTQPAADEGITITSSTGNEVSGQGENFRIIVNTVDDYDTEWEGFITFTDPSNTTNWVRLEAGNTGTDSGEFFVYVDPNYVGSNGYNGNPRNFSIRVDAVDGSPISNTLYFYQNVGTAPVVAPTFTVSPTSLTWDYSQSGIGAYKTITATQTGGTTANAVSFYIVGNHFGLIETDSNVPVNVSGGPYVAEAINDGAGNFQIGVYPLDVNNNTSDNDEDLVVNMGAGASSTTSLNVPMKQTYPINWSTTPSSLSFTSDGGTKIITLSTSFSWTASVSGTGFSINTTSGTAGTNTISVTATSDIRGRSGTVTFSASGQSDIVVPLTQAAAPLEGDLFYPYFSTDDRPGWGPGELGGVYEELNHWGASESTPSYLSFQFITNRAVTYEIREFNSSVQIVRPTSDLALTDNSIITRTSRGSTAQFRAKVLAPSAGSSVSFTLEFISQDDASDNFSIDFTLGRTSTSGGGGGTKPDPGDIL